MSTPVTPVNPSFWDQRYSAPGLLFGDAPNAFLAREAARLAPHSQILCVAEGEGRNALHLAGLGHVVTAFDGSAVAVEKARAWAAERSLTVDFRVSGAQDWVWVPAAFDAVVAVFVQFAPPPLRQAMFHGMWQSLKPGGLLLIEGYTPRQLDYKTGGPEQIDQLYTPEVLKTLLPDATWEYLTEYDTDLAEGTAHRGRSAVIDAVARKPGSLA
jgi:SAM-dependent methyltransferase